MKPNQNKTKLNLKKKAVSNLTGAELSGVKAGNEEAWTTSRKACTGFLCCEPPTIDCSFTNCTTCLPTATI